MDQTLKNFIDLLEQELPPLCDDEDLIRAGIFGSRPTASRMRSQGISPNFFRLGANQIRYLKADVLTWLESRYHKIGGGNGARR